MLYQLSYGTFAFGKSRYRMSRCDEICKLCAVAGVVCSTKISILTNQACKTEVSALRNQQSVSRLFGRLVVGDIYVLKLLGIEVGIILQLLVDPVCEFELEVNRLLGIREHLPDGI